jgi:anaerobic magnesium-protoporphyrin IX monomethyl ester cyclase
VRSLLLSMPDSCEHNTPTVAVRMPNDGLASLGGKLDPHHRVAIADLLPVQAAVRPTLEQFVRSHRAADRKLGL